MPPARSPVFLTSPAHGSCLVCLVEWRALFELLPQRFPAVLQHLLHWVQLQAVQLGDGHRVSLRQQVDGGRDLALEKVGVSDGSHACPVPPPALTLLSMSARSLSRSFCQSCSCLLILATSSCIMWFSCSVVASNWIRLTLDARALLSAFCQRTARGQECSSRSLPHPSVTPTPPALAGEETGRLPG